MRHKPTPAKQVLITQRLNFLLPLQVSRTMNPVHPNSKQMSSIMTYQEPNNRPIQRSLLGRSKFAVRPIVVALTLMLMPTLVLGENLCGPDGALSKSRNGSVQSRQEKEIGRAHV